MPYSETLEYLYQLQSHGIQPGLARITSMLALFGDPEKSFHSIHIAGTNGKGSTASMVASILAQTQLKVGLYTSPHMLDFSERIQINGSPISQDDIVRLTEFLRDQIERKAPRLAEKVTFFEFTTALAFYYFAEQHVDFVVAEVGMGGQFDATNILSPCVSSITQIALDHEDYLGNTISDVAAEKAGIIKTSVPIVSAALHPEAQSVIDAIAREKNAPLSLAGQCFSATLLPRKETQSLVDPMEVHYRGLSEHLIQVPLLGEHQVQNAATSLSIVESLQTQGFDITSEHLRQGIRKVRVAGRLEVVQQQPLILLDGAHNPAGASALASFLEKMQTESIGKHWLISGMMQDKNIEKLLQPLVDWTDEFVFTRPKVRRAADPTEISCIAAVLVKQCEAAAKDITVQEEVSEALHYVRARMQTNDTLVITGSFYTIGEAKGSLLGVSPSAIRG